MPLKPVVDTLDGIDETLHGLYTERDGRYRLDIDGGFSTPDEIEKLSSALAKEREARREYERKIKNYDGIDPDKAREAFDALSKIDQKKLIDAGDVDKLKAQISAAYEDRIKEKDSVTQQLQAALQEKENILQNELIGGRFKGSAFIREKMADNYFPDVVKAIFGAQFKIKDGNVVGYDKHGTEIYSKQNPGEIAAFDEALSILVETHPNRNLMLKGGTATGSGSAGSTGLMGVDWQKMNPQERMNAARKAGVKT